MIPFEFFNRITVLDTPCGAGKPYTMSQVGCNAIHSSVVVLTISLGQQLQLNVYCAMDIDGVCWKVASCLCLRCSLVYVAQEMLSRYDIVVIDEAGALPRQY